MEGRTHEARQEDIITEHLVVDGVPTARHYRKGRLLGKVTSCGTPRPPEAEAVCCCRAGLPGFTRSQSWRRGECLRGRLYRRVRSPSPGPSRRHHNPSLLADGSRVVLPQLMTEINIHRGLDHPNIVKFERYFEDEAAVYLVLELCDNQVC